jgi:hypothetical protein
MNSQFRSAARIIGPFTDTAMRSLGGSPPVSTLWGLPKGYGSTPGSTGAPIQEHVDPLLSPQSVDAADDGGANPSAGPADQ